jgi:hypothetical protein
MLTFSPEANGENRPKQIDMGLSKKSSFFFLDSPKWEGIKQESAFQTAPKLAALEENASCYQKDA